MEEFRNCFTASEGTTNTDTTNTSQEVHRFSPGSQVHPYFFSTCVCPSLSSTSPSCTESSRDLSAAGWHWPMWVVLPHNERVELFLFRSGLVELLLCNNPSLAAFRSEQSGEKLRSQNLLWGLSCAGADPSQHRWRCGHSTIGWLWLQANMQVITQGGWRRDGDRKASAFVLFLVESGFNLEPD